MTDSNMNEGNLVIPVERVPVAAYQAIYHQLTQKTETLSKNFNGAFRVKFEDFHELYRQLDQMITQYQVKGRTSQVFVTLSNGEIHRFDSFEKFSTLNFGAITHSTTGISFAYDFLVVLPSDDPRGENISQRYKVLIIITNERQRDDHMIISGGRFSRDIELASLPIITRIEYTDYAVARNLQSLLTEWTHRLEFQDELSISFKTSRLIERSIDYSTMVLFASAFLGGVLFEPTAYANFLTPMRYLVMVLTTGVVALIVGFFISDRSMRVIRSLREKTIILLTHGDAVAHRNLIAARHSSRKLLGVIFVAIILATAVSIFSNYLSGMIISSGQ